ncbi:hypothetical protein PUN28_018047 [Cardiocondyla obscurior]|uniref:Secreted protein n=1 Tax=Cardiocondyla obscurior TaxID=286306 RepID=A0AAW2EHN6_9HYME
MDSSIAYLLYRVVLRTRACVVFYFRVPLTNGAEFQRNAVELSRDTISIPRKPEPSSLARTRDSREYVEFLSAMFVVGVHRSERARWRRDECTRALGTDRPIFERCARIRACRIQRRFCRALAYRTCIYESTETSCIVLRFLRDFEVLKKKKNNKKKNQVIESRYK